MRCRELVIVALGLSLTLGMAGCGSNPMSSSSTDTPAGGSGGDAPSAGSGGDAPSAGGGSGGGNGCQALTCAAQGKNCGDLPDGCGGVLDCGGCSGGSICGLLTANVCTSPAELCLRLPSADVCSGKECGLDGDGCGGTYPCGTCTSGEVCGVSAPFQCGAVPVVSETDCPARIESCAAVGAECGLIGNGCGGSIDCGGCGPGELCGIDAPQRCDPAVCEPLGAAIACTGKCGLASNGCGNEVAEGVIDCTIDFPCAAGESCGGGGVANQCGSGVFCQPLGAGAACATRECGAAGDGCGGAHDCGDCSAGEVCRSGLCEAPSCTPSSAAAPCSDKECGRVGDGCGGVIDCDTCAQGEQCGTREAFQCDRAGACVGASAAEACAGKECGLVLDGCGTQPENTFDCAVENGDGACPDGELCGVLAPFQCDVLAPGSCVPDATTCAGLGWACGKALDSCGGVHDCAAESRACDPLETCVGGITGPTQCVTSGSGSGDCTLCNSVPNCANQPQLTRVTGRVITPGRADDNIQNQVGVPNAFVYILRNNDLGDLPGMAAGSGGSSCDRCSDPDLGPVLVSAVTDANGEFVLEGNIPIGVEFPLVVKAGKFRRAVTQTLSAGAACQTTALAEGMPANPTRLPRTMSDGLAVNIPRIAVSTGAVDAIECVLEKMGVAASEFSRPQLGGRVHLYRANGAWPDQQSFDCNGCFTGNGPTSNACRLANCGGSTSADRVSFLQAVSDASLFGSLASLSAHDTVVFDCEGLGWDDTFTQRDAAGGNVREYVNRGGRMFASHFGFTWLSGNGSQPYSALDPIGTGLSAAATWDNTTYADLTGTGVVSVVGVRPRASARVDLFADWLSHHGVTTAPGYTFPITEPRSMASGLGAASEEFVYRSPDAPAQADPPGYDRRVQQFSFNTPYAAPSDATCGRVSYSGFHVASTAGIASPFENMVFPAHCRDALANNGNLTNQEKALLFMFFDLGTCVGSAPSPPVCTPRACPDGGSCGTLPDGCGDIINCGCSGGAACIDRECAPPPCVPTTCEAEGVICSSMSDGCGGTVECECPLCTPASQQAACATVSCGYASDGCSDVYFCSSCPADCVPLTQCPSSQSCGTLSDGCDGTLGCGECAPEEVCGGREPNVCAALECQPLSCEEVNADCGTIGDGCGGVVLCGDCLSGQVCTSVDGVPNQCQGCQPMGCEGVAADCGLLGDGCGGVVSCGICPSGLSCGAQAANRCGSSGQCAPRSCGDVAAECGLVGDGCGDVLDCGACSVGAVCGLEQAFQCAVPPPCMPSTCVSLDAECGLISDGCSGVVDCGPCAGSG